MRISHRVALTALLAGASFAAQAKTISVTLVNGHPPVFRWVKHLQQTFVPAVDKALQGTDIKVAWKQQYGGSLAKVGEELEAARDGLADIALVPTIFELSKMPLQNITYYTPFVSTDPGVVTSAVEKVQRQTPEMMAAWDDNGLVYIGGGFALDDYLLFTKFPLEKLSDLDGRKIGTPGPSVNWMKGTGAVGVAGDLTQYYSAIQTGLYDGVVTFATAALPAKIQEVAPYITRLEYGAQYAGGLAANRDWFESQPEALRKALRAGAAAFGKAYLDDLRAASVAAVEQLANAGGKLNNRSQTLRQDYVKAMANPVAAWVQQLEAHKLPARQVLDRYMKVVKEEGARPARDWSKE